MCLILVPASFWASSYRWQPAIVGRHWDSVGGRFTSGSSKLQRHTMHTDNDEVGHKVNNFDLAGWAITRSYAKPLCLHELRFSSCAPFVIHSPSTSCEWPCVLSHVVSIQEFPHSSALHTGVCHFTKGPEVSRLTPLSSHN